MVMFAKGGTAEGKGSILAQIPRGNYDEEFPKFLPVAVNIHWDKHYLNMRFKVQQRHNLGCPSTNWWKFENFPEETEYINTGKIVMDSYAVEENGKIHLIKAGPKPYIHWC